MGSQTDAKNAETARLCSLIVSGLIAILFVILTIYLGLYGYSEVDPKQCWVIYGLSTAALTKEEAISKAQAAGITVQDGYPIDMHKIFQVWCRWGLFQNSAFLVFAAGWISIGAFIPWGVKRMSGVTSIAFGLGTTVWLAIGGIWRFSYGGRVAAGDKI